MYCPRLEAEITAEDCGKIQNNDCPECENFEPFIWFMLEQERTCDNGEKC